MEHTTLERIYPQRAEGGLGFLPKEQESEVFVLMTSWPQDKLSYSSYPKLTKLKRKVWFRQCFTMIFKPWLGYFHPWLWFIASVRFKVHSWLWKQELKILQDAFLSRSGAFYHVTWFSWADGVGPVALEIHTLKCLIFLVQFIWLNTTMKYKMGKTKYQDICWQRSHHKVGKYHL